MAYTRLTPEQIEKARELKDTGVESKRIAQAFKEWYGVHRTTVYRYITENPEAYRWRQRPPKVESPLKPFVQHFKEQGFTSLEIATATGIPLQAINEAWI